MKVLLRYACSTWYFNVSSECTAIHSPCRNSVYKYIIFILLQSIHTISLHISPLHQVMHTTFIGLSSYISLILWSHFAMYYRMSLCKRSSIIWQQQLGHGNSLAGTRCCRGLQELHMWKDTQSVPEQISPGDISHCHQRRSSIYCCQKQLTTRSLEALLDKMREVF